MSGRIIRRPSSLFEQNALIRVTGPRGGAEVLSEEVGRLCPEGVRIREEGVELDGTLDSCMRLNLWLRTANRVLYELKTFCARDPDQLYQEVKTIPWEKYLSPSTPFSIHGFVRNPGIRDSRYASLKTKDAIADRFVAELGRRPDSGSDRGNFVVFLHWIGEQATLYIDTSGETLARHGYRKIPLEAPLQESLAAAVVHATRWDRESTLVNPMCGAGTLAIEAALLAAGRAPGLLRDNFGFMHVKGFDPKRWERLRSEAAATPKRPRGRILASDNRAEAVAAARKNARSAGVEQWIEFSLCDFRDMKMPSPPGVLLFNPEYGQRLGQEAYLAGIYAAIGDFLKQKGGGYWGYVFTGNPELAKKIGLRTTSRKIFFNGPIECRLLEYELYPGSRKGKENIRSHPL